MFILEFEWTEVMNLHTYVCHSPSSDDANVYDDTQYITTTCTTITTSWFFTYCSGWGWVVKSLLGNTIWTTEEHVSFVSI